MQEECNDKLFINNLEELTGVPFVARSTDLKNLFDIFKESTRSGNIEWEAFLLKSYPRIQELERHEAQKKDTQQDK